MPTTHHWNTTHSRIKICMRTNAAWKRREHYSMNNTRVPGYLPESLPGHLLKDEVDSPMLTHRWCNNTITNKPSSRKSYGAQARSRQPIWLLDQEAPVRVNLDGSIERARRLLEVNLGRPPSLWAFQDHPARTRSFFTGGIEISIGNL